MAESKSVSNSDKKTKIDSKGLPQIFLVTVNVFSIVFAAEAGIFAIVAAISALAAKGFATGLAAFGPFCLGLSAVVFGLIAMFTIKKITDRDMSRKAWGIVAAILFVQIVLMSVVLVGVIFFALFAAGAGGAVQKELWLNTFLPVLGITAVLVGLLFVVKKIYEGMNKLVPIIIYIIFGVAGIALILSIIAAFIGFYGHNSYYEIFDDTFNDFYNTYN